MSESLTMSIRCLRISRRQLDSLITSLLLPVLLLIVFVELFGGAIDTGTKYVTYVVPGVLVLCAGFSSGLTAVAVCQDMVGGIVDRLRSMDVGGGSVLTGHVTASIVRNAVSAALVTCVALLLGFHPHADALEWLAAGAVLLGFVVALSSFAAVLGLLAGSPEAANGATFLIMFLPYASSAFVPVHTMPGWLHGFAANQPITPVTETLRALLLGGSAHAQVLAAVAWCAGIVACSLVAASVLFGRRTS